MCLRRYTRLDTCRPRDYPRLTSSIRRPLGGHGGRACPTRRSGWRSSHRTSAPRSTASTSPRPLDERTFAEVHDALIEHGVIFFRDQDISVESAEGLRPALRRAALPPQRPGPAGGPSRGHDHPRRREVEARRGRELALRRLLRPGAAHGLDPAHPHAAARRRRHALRQHVRRLRSALGADEALPRWPDGDFTTARPTTAASTRASGSRRGKEYPNAEHPVVRTHPESGRKALFVNEMFTTRIVDLSQQGERRGPRAVLTATSRRPSFSAASAGARTRIAFWDNRCVQHMAIWDYWPQHALGLPRDDQGRQAVLPSLTG